MFGSGPERFHDYWELVDHFTLRMESLESLQLRSLLVRPQPECATLFFTGPECIETNARALSCIQGKLHSSRFRKPFAGKSLTRDPEDQGTGIVIGVSSLVAMSDRQLYAAQEVRHPVRRRCCVFDQSAIGEMKASSRQCVCAEQLKCLVELGKSNVRQGLGSGSARRSSVGRMDNHAVGQSRK